jgi:hypothetical protein
VTRFGYLQVVGFDVDISAAYTVYDASTGVTLGALREVNSGDGQPFDGDGHLFSNIRVSPLKVPKQVTVKDSLGGGSVTVPVTIVKPY